MGSKPFNERALRKGKTCSRIDTKRSQDDNPPTNDVVVLELLMSSNPQSSFALLRPVTEISI
ncbi:hypothetical protein P3L10_014245 [Capsicum annuum]